MKLLGHQYSSRSPALIHKLQEVCVANGGIDYMQHGREREGKEKRVNGQPVRAASWALDEEKALRGRESYGEENGHYMIPLSVRYRTVCIVPCLYTITILPGDIIYTHKPHPSMPINDPGRYNVSMEGNLSSRKTMVVMEAYTVLTTLSTEFPNIGLLWRQWAGGVVDDKNKVFLQQLLSVAEVMPGNEMNVLWLDRVVRVSICIFKRTREMFGNGTYRILAREDLYLFTMCGCDGWVFDVDTALYITEELRFEKMLIGCFAHVHQLAILPSIIIVGCLDHLVESSTFERAFSFDLFVDKLDTFMLFTMSCMKSSTWQRRDTKLVGWAVDEGLHVILSRAPSVMKRISAPTVCGTNDVDCTRFLRAVQLDVL
jgi:hypothetical protein